MDAPSLEEFTRPRQFVRNFQLASGERVLLETSESLDKRVWRQPTWFVHRIVLALQLMGFALWGRGVATRREHPIGLGMLGSPLQIAKHRAWTDFTQTDLDRAIALAAIIPDETFADPRAPQTIALSRYASAYADRTATDALIDLVVALEAVLLPREFEGELKFRLALYGAYATGADAAERPNLFKELAKIYDTRSDIVHGKRVESVELEAIVASAKRITARVVRQGLERGWPNQDELKAAVLE